MANELEQLIGEEDTEKSKTPSAEDEAAAAKAKAESEANQKTEEEKKAEQLANLNKAIEESNNELRKLRQKTRAAKRGEPIEEDEEEVPEINDADPSAQAWNRRIRETVAPVQAELEKSQTEVRTLALKKFLADKPATAADPQKVKALLSKYEKLRESSETNVDVVLDELNQAFAAVNHQALVEAARGRRVESAKTDELFSAPAVDGGSTSYSGRPEPETPIKISKSDETWINRMYGSVDNYKKILQEQREKESET